jgi:hypothetical protein
LVVPVYGGVGWVVEGVRVDIRENKGNNKNIGRGVLG